MDFDYSEITPSDEQRRAAQERMAEGLAAEAVNRLRVRLLARWPSATELRWTRAPDDEGQLRHALLLDADGRLLATGEEFAVQAPLRGAVFVHDLERHSEPIGAEGAPQSWRVDLTFERERHPGDARAPGPDA